MILSNLSLPKLDDFLSLLYPNLCLACEKNTPTESSQICLQCQADLPQTNFHLEKENALMELFWGRIELVHATALYYFRKGGRTQHLIHQLKYANQPQIGVQLGELLGIQLATSAFYQDIDYVIPVPLHPRKERIRGYNQSDAIAQGISSGMGKPWERGILRRVVFTETQTKKNRMERMKNVGGAFEVFTPHRIEGKHILLVDDVVTTGATLEVCALTLLKIKGVRVSLAVLGYAGGI